MTFGAVYRFNMIVCDKKQIVEILFLNRCMVCWVFTFIKKIAISAIVVEFLQRKRIKYSKKGKLERR